MNGTKYTDPDSMRELAARLADVSDASTFLSVRTPAQWERKSRGGGTGRLDREPAGQKAWTLMTACWEA